MALSTAEREADLIRAYNDPCRLSFSAWNVDICRPIEQAFGKPKMLQKPRGTSLHHYRDYLKLLTSSHEPSDRFKEALSDAAWREVQSFVIEHDWAAAFDGAKDFDGGEYNLPFDRVCFEFLVNGVRTLVLLTDQYRSSTKCGILATGIDGHWSGWNIEMKDDRFRFEEFTLDNLPADFDRTVGPVKDPLIANWYLDFVTKQVRAACIMMEAEVAIAELVRSPEKLNRARVKLGRSPLSSYNVVKLAHRHRVKPGDTRATEFDPDYTRKRLHFRRGHKRRYQNYSIDIKWCLVGDPDLGFVDKHYKL